MNWNNISIEQYNRIKDIDNTQETLDVMIEIAAIIHKVEADKLYDMPISELTNYLEGIEFIFETPEPELKDSITVNGVKYKLDANIHSWNTGRYIDYMRVIEQMPDRLDLIMATLYMPEGKKYGEFDIIKSAKVLGENVPITYVLGASTFFLTLLKSLTKTILSSSKKDLNPQQKKMVEQVEGMMDQFGI